jgi:hypothetical protein
MVSNMPAATASLPSANPTAVRRRWVLYCFVFITIVTMFLVDFRVITPYKANTEVGKDRASRTRSRTTMTKEYLAYLSNSTEAHALTVTADDWKAFTKNVTYATENVDGVEDRVKEADGLQGVSDDAEEAHLDASTVQAGNSTLLLSQRMVPAQIQDSTNELFLEYAIHGGWSNQLNCILNAYYMARATGRTLVTAPVLPHYNVIGGTLWIGNRFQKKHGTSYISSRFRLDYPLADVYGKHSRLPLGRVLDMQFTFPNVSTIEYQTFREKYYHNGHTNLSHWVMEANYTHGNTMFHYQQPALDNTPLGGGVTHRDISTIAEQGKHHQLWTFLDTFYGRMHPSMGVRHKTRFRYSEVIRNTAKTIQQQVWNNTPYSSIHLRVGDAHFKENADLHIKEVIEMNKERLQGWILHRLASSQTIPSSLGVFVATDLEAEKQSSFSNQISSALSDLQSEHNFVVRIYYSASFEKFTRALKPSLVHPDIYLDQQLAACAPIAFTPSTGSSFSNAIGWLRSTCDFPRGQP